MDLQCRNILARSREHVQFRKSFADVDSSLQLTNFQTGGSQIWEDRVTGIINSLPYFFQNNIMMESACENVGTCDVDQLSFKAYLSRWMAATTVRAPFTYNLLIPYLQASAMGAASACSGPAVVAGGTSDTTCGMKWTTGTYDGLTGVGQQMSAL